MSQEHRRHQDVSETPRWRLRNTTLMAFYASVSAHWTLGSGGGIILFSKPHSLTQGLCINNCLLNINWIGPISTGNFNKLLPPMELLGEFNGSRQKSTVSSGSWTPITVGTEENTMLEDGRGNGHPVPLPHKGRGPQLRGPQTGLPQSREEPAPCHPGVPE